VLTANAQNSIEWDVLTTINRFSIKSHKLDPRIAYSIHTASVLDFGFIMNNVEFMSQFNSKVNCSFQRDAGSLIAPDTIRLINYWILLAMNLTYLNSMPVNCKEIYEQKGTFLMLAFKSIYDKINMPKSNGNKKQLIWP
jgi:hypothetical protein